MALGVYFTLLTLCAVFGTSVQLSKKCPGRWSNFGDTCYLFSGDLVTWYEANARCAEEGANLAEPDTMEKLQFLSQIQGGWPGMWLGGSDRQTEGEWVWSSSWSPIAPSLWLPGRPDSWLDEEDCLLMYSGDLWDQQCTVARSYLCEAKANTFIL